MIEPVALSDFFISFFSAAMIILVAALYAGVYTWAETTGKNSLFYRAQVVYLVLLGFVGLFSFINHLNGYWLSLTVLMAIGYWWMPRLIWRLCESTHADDINH